MISNLGGCFWYRPLVRQGGILWELLDDAGRTLATVTRGDRPGEWRYRVWLPGAGPEFEHVQAGKAGWGVVRSVARCKRLAEKWLDRKAYALSVSE